MPFNSRFTPAPATEILRARVVLPISRPLIENGAVAISGNRITQVGRWEDFNVPFGARVTDLGESILLPGLVNAHCHLDYTNMAGQLSPQRSFVDWIQLIMTSKSGWLYSDFAQSWMNGAKMLVRTGTTTVGDIEMVPDLLPEVWSATPLRVISFLELTGVKSRRPPAEMLDEAVHKITSMPTSRCRMGISPHAPYSTLPELLRLSAQTSHRHKLPIVTHVSESDEEFEMFFNGRGKMYDWLKRNGREMSDCGRGSPIQHLERHGFLGENLLAVHANYLAAGDAELLAKHRVNVVHCPRSHDFFKHRRFPLAELVGAGVNICLGTDSLASLDVPRKIVPELNLFAEMRQLAAAMPTVDSETILQMATINGAAALGLKKQVGELTPGAFADLISLPFDGRLIDANLAVVNHDGDVATSMIDGQWAVTPEIIATGV